MALSKITNLSITDDAVRTVGIQDDNVTLAKLGDGTQGDILYYGASGAPARLGFGTSGDFLKTQGTGANPTWATVSGGAFASETFAARMDTLRTFTSGSDNTVIFEEELWDSDSAYNTGTGKFIVPTAGYYLFGGTIKFHETASQFISCTIYMNVAGVQEQVCQWYDLNGQSSQVTLTYSVPSDSLSVSDEVYMQAAAGTYDSSSYNCPAGWNASFWGVRIA